jgi:hypothetical protein
MARLQSEPVVVFWGAGLFSFASRRIRVTEFADGANRIA